MVKALEKSFLLIYSNTHIYSCETVPLKDKKWPLGGAESYIGLVWILLQGRKLSGAGSQLAQAATRILTRASSLLRSAQIYAFKGQGQQIYEILVDFLKFLINPNGSLVRETKLLK